MPWNSQTVFQLLIINAGGGFTGLFVYSPSPGAGKLIASIAAAAGTDPYGNAYVQGFAIYDASGVRAQLNGSILNMFASAGGSLTPGSLSETAGGNLHFTSGLTAVGGDTQGIMSLFSAQASPIAATPLLQLALGTDLEVLSAIFAGGPVVVNGAATSTAANLEVNSLLAIATHAAPATPPAGWGYVYVDTNGAEHFKDSAGNDTIIAPFVKLPNFSVPATPASGADMYTTADVLRMLKASGWDGALDSSQTDSTDRTVTQAVSNLLGGQYSIPAGDLKVNTTYEYKTGGTGQWGSTQQQLTLIEALAGVNQNQVNVAAAAFPVSTPFDWDLEMRLVCKTTGVSGTCNLRLRVTLSTNNAAALNTNSVSAVRRAAAVAINTTIANNFELDALWASTTGAPTITANNSSLTRKGP